MTLPNVHYIDVDYSRFPKLEFTGCANQVMAAEEFLCPSTEIMLIYLSGHKFITRFCCDSSVVIQEHLGEHWLAYSCV